MPDIFNYLSSKVLNGNCYFMSLSTILPLHNNVSVFSEAFYLLKVNIISSFLAWWPTGKYWRLDWNTSRSCALTMKLICPLWRGKVWTWRGRPMLSSWMWGNWASRWTSTRAYSCPEVCLQRWWTSGLNRLTHSRLHSWWVYIYVTVLCEEQSFRVEDVCFWAFLNL